MEEDEENILFTNDISTSIPDPNVPKEINNDRELQDRGDVELPYEPENTVLTILLAKQIEQREPEEIRKQSSRLTSAE
jgi:hypothetical protein